MSRQNLREAVLFAIAQAIVCLRHVNRNLIVPDSKGITAVGREVRDIAGGLTDEEIC